jgi:uncharacterized protein YkwD
VATGGAQAVEPVGSHHVNAASNSVSVSISGVKKARVKVRGERVRRTVRSSTVLRLPAGKYTMRAFAVTSGGTLYKPSQRTYRVRAKTGQAVLVAVTYQPVTSNNVSTGQQRIPADPVPDGDFATMFALVNEARSKQQQCGSKTMPPVAPVVYNAEIAKAAQAHAQDMADKNYFDHDSLDGRSFADRIRATNYSGDPAGENIASGFPTAQETLHGWLKSPGHCVNLMDAEFDTMGLGLAVQQDSRYSNPVTYWVQDFGYDPSSR